MEGVAQVCCEGGSASGFQGGAPAKVAGTSSSDSIVSPQHLEGSQILGWRM